MKRLPVVALTFDDGPSEWTPLLLDVLAKREARATFFVLGQHIEGNEKILARAHREGHELAIHGWDHKPVDVLTPGALLGQIEATASMLEDITGVEPRWWRPPWNRVEGAALAIADRGFGYCTVTLDGFDVSRSEDKILKTIREGLVGGAIVGLHDGIAPNGEQGAQERMRTVNVVRKVLGWCRSVTVSELLA